MKIRNQLLILSLCAFAGNSGQAAVIAYYRAEGTNGSQIGSTLADSSGNGRDITVSGATASDKYLNIVANDPSPIPQTGATNTTMLNINTRGSTTGGSLSLTAASNAAWNNIFAKQAFTIEGWVSPSDYLYGQNFTIASRGNIYGTGWTLVLVRVSNSSEQLFFRSGGSSITALTVTGLTNGHMDYFSVVGQANGDLAFSYAGQTATVSAASYTASSDTSSVVNFFQGDSSKNFQIDEVRFSNTALTSGQMLNAVPEPATFGLLGIGALAVAAGFRNRRVKHEI